jgi:23S rRNA pseudouridine2604 synthase
MEQRNSRSFGSDRRGPRRDFRGSRPALNGSGQKKTYGKPAPVVHSFPMRINKYLAWKGYSSRRGADDLITGGKVLINGRVAVLGDKVNEADQVVLASDAKKTHAYFLINKPKGISIDSLITKLSTLCFAVEPMDKEASGIILLTNDGRIIRELGSRSVPSRYHIVFNKLLTPSFLKILTVGAQIEKRKYPNIKVEQDGPDSAFLTMNRTSLRDLNDIATHFGFEIHSADRISYGVYSAPNINPGTWRELTEKEKGYIPNIFGVNL